MLNIIPEIISLISVAIYVWIVKIISNAEKGISNEYKFVSFWSSDFFKDRLTSVSDMRYPLPQNNDFSIDAFAFWTFFNIKPIPSFAHRDLGPKSI